MLSQNTLRMYTFYNTKFLAFKSVSNIEDIELCCKAFLRNVQQSPSTFRIIKSALEYFNGIVLDINPTTSCQLEYPLSEQDILSEIQFNDLISTTKNKKHRFIIGFTYYTGMRPSELVNLKYNDIDYSRNIIIIPESKNHNNKRIIYISSFLMAFLKQYIPDEEISVSNNKYVLSTCGKKMSIRSIQHLMQSAGDRIGIHLNPRTLRHLFATHSLDFTQDIRYIQSTMGHHILSTTEKYLDSKGVYSVP